MGRKFEWGVVLGTAAAVAFAVAYGTRGGSSAEKKALEAGREEFRRLLASQPKMAERIDVPPTPPKPPTPGDEVAGPKPPTGSASPACREFYHRIFADDFSSLPAERMNRLPTSNGCVPERPLPKSVVENYENSCRKGATFPATYALWTDKDKERAKNCLMWVWFVRSAVLAERMKGEDPERFSDPTLLSTWLFGSFLAFDFDKLPAIAHRLSEVDRASVLGAKAALMQPLAAIGEVDPKTAKRTEQESFWTDAEREWRRASELAPGDKDVEFAGVMIRTRNMDLPRLKKELEERQAAYGANDSLGAYLGGYYVSKTQSKEAAIPLLLAGAKRFPADAKRFQDAAEACRTKAKCEFQLTYKLDVTRFVRTEDVIH